MNEYTAVDISNAVLEHHGIIGQKWGIRRYQNPDGSLTDAGRKRKDASNKKEKNGLTDRQKKL